MLTAPSISKDLITYLEKVFPSTIPTSPLNANPHEVAAAVHFISGRGAVIDHLTAVYEEQHNEDPLNVYEDTEAT
jgi:hypothetical protein